ncbi:MAG: hypothetical protein AVDCRST_MAG93-8109, partial [uncultured Chloroflexia bacterium]
WEEGTGVKLSCVTMHRISKRLGVSRKKRPSHTALHCWLS